MGKIGVLTGRLNGGGAERSAGLVSKILSNLDHDVSVITLHDDIAYPYAGTLINLGKISNSESSSIRRIFSRYINLHKELKKSRFDLILDFRFKESWPRELILNLLVFNTKIVNMVRSFKLDWYLPKPKLLSSYIYKNYAGINTVSIKIKKLIEEKFNFTNVSVIYNPIDLDYISERSKEGQVLEEDFIIAIGRIDANKQFDFLIKSYNNSILKQKNIKLYIIGKDVEKDKLTLLIRKLKLEENVKILPFQSNPFTFIKQAKYLVLSSKNEGFPRVLIEALACNTPVVSFDCNSGPSEIVKHRQNGLLVKNQDFKALTEAMNEMIQDNELYKHCKLNCLLGLEEFSMKTIEGKWKDFIEDLMAK